MESIDNNLLYQSPSAIKRENSEPSEGRSSSNSLQISFQTMAPTPNINVTPSNSFVARVTPAQQLPALYPSFHSGMERTHSSEEGSHYSDFQSEKGASLTHQFDSQYSDHNLDESVSSEYLPYSPAEFCEGQDSNARQESKLTAKTQPLELTMGNIPKNNTADAEASSMKRPSGDGDVLPSAKRLAAFSYNGCHSIPQQPPSTNLMSPIISQPLSSTEEVARRPIAQAHRPSMARKNGRAPQPETPIKVERASNLHTPTHSASSYNHDQQYYEATPQPRVTVRTSAEASHGQMGPASFSGTLDHLQGHAASNLRARRDEMARMIKNEEGAAPLPQQVAAPLVDVENPNDDISLAEELDYMRGKMQRISRKMARQAAHAEAYAVDSYARSVDANRRIGELNGEFLVGGNEVVGLRKEVGELRDEFLGLKSQASESKIEAEGLREEVARLNHEVVRLERDALRREVRELRRRVL